MCGKVYLPVFFLIHIDTIFSIARENLNCKCFYIIFKKKLLKQSRFEHFFENLKRVSALEKEVFYSAGTYRFLF